MKALLGIGLAAFSTSILLAGDAAITELNQVDAKYAYIGEYVGTTNQGSVGVRIATQAGPAPLFARVYPGGLPGLGWGTTKPELVVGNMDGDGLALKGEESGGRQVRFANNQMMLIEPNGQEIPLRKIARRSVMLGKPAPVGSKVLFDGKDTSAWKSANVTSDGLLKAGAETVDPIGGGHLHVEFRTPYMAASKGQKRGNSGIYLQRRYEVQVLDSFALEGVENDCGAIYLQRRPDLNMALPPLVWQSYDIFFQPAVFSSTGEKTKGAELTVIHNGVPVHYHTLIKAKTGAGKAEGPEPLPLLLQDHSDPVVYRNVWFVPSGSLPVVQSNYAAKLTEWLPTKTIPLLR